MSTNAPAADAPAETSTNPYSSAEAWDPSNAMLPVGDHVVKIMEAEDETSSNQNPQIILRFGNDQGTIKCWETYHDKFLGKIVALYDAAGVERPAEGEFNPNDKCRLTQKCIDRLLDKEIGIVVREETDTSDPLNPKVRKRVQGYIEPSRITEGPDTRGLPGAQAASSSRPPEEAQSKIPF